MRPSVVVLLPCARLVGFSTVKCFEGGVCFFFRRPPAGTPMRLALEVFPWFEEEKEEIKPLLWEIPHPWYTFVLFRYLFSFFSILIPLSASFFKQVVP